MKTENFAPGEKPSKMKILRPAIVCILVLTLLTGIAYPLLVTGASQVLFNKQANGSIVSVKLADGTTVDYGSEHIAQTFTEPQYMIGRPTTENNAPTNLSPMSEDQAALVQERVDWWHAFDPGNTAEIPTDLVTVSGSGVDPHISPEAAEYQVARIARERNLSEETLREVVKRYTTGRFLGIFGEPAVNVLLVNLSLDGKLDDGIVTK